MPRIFPTPSTPPLRPRTPPRLRHAPSRPPPHNPHRDHTCTIFPLRQTTHHLPMTNRLTTSLLLPRPRASTSIRQINLNSCPCRESAKNVPTKSSKNAHNALLRKKLTLQKLKASEKKLIIKWLPCSAIYSFRYVY